MKIAIVCPTSHFKPYDGDSLKTQSLGASWGGVIQLARELFKLGHEVNVLNHCPRPGKYDGVNYLTEKVPEDIVSKRHVQRALQGTDALIVNRAGNMDYHDCLEAAGVTNYKKYLWCLDAGGAQQGQPEKFAHFDKVVSISDWLNQINIDANYKIAPDYFVSIPIGVDTNLFKPIEPDEADLLNSAPNRFDVCFVGAVVSARRPQLAIEAFARAKKMRLDLPLRLHMIGSAAVWGGPPEGGDDQGSVVFRSMMDDARRFAAEFQDSIKEYSDIPNEEVAQILPEMGMMIYPTQLETGGVSIMEAQACGVPVIVPLDAMHTAVGERIYHTETGIVRDFAQMDEVAKSIIDMATNDHVYNKVRTQAREKVVRENDWPTIAKRWETEVLNARTAVEIIEEREKMKEKKIGVGILSWRNRPLFQKCVESLMASAQMPLEIVVWDNNSKGHGSDNAEWLRREYPEITLMELDQNFFCTKSRNGVIEWFRKNHPEIEFMLFTDMDVIFKPGFLFPMVEIMEQKEDAAIVAYEEANCGFKPREDNSVSEVMSICNLHRMSSFDIFENPNRPFDETFKVYSFDSWICQVFNVAGWKTYIVRGRRGYDHVGGQIDQLLTDSENIKSADVKYWQSIADKMAIKKPWEHKNSADYITIGNKLKDDNDHDGAQREYEQGISRFPDDTTLHFCLGNLYKDLKKYPEALESYDNALAKNPQWFEVIWAREQVAREVNAWKTGFRLVKRDTISVELRVEKGG